MPSKKAKKTSVDETPETEDENLDETDQPDEDGSDETTDETDTETPNPPSTPPEEEAEPEPENDAVHFKNRNITTLSFVMENGKMYSFTNGVFSTRDQQVIERLKLTEDFKNWFITEYDPEAVQANE